MSAILLDDKIVHYEVLGRGRPVIFVHGWVGSWRYWVPAMQACSVSFRAYALDLWGFGDTARDPALYSLEQQALLLDRFLQEMGIAKVALIGHSLGALIAAIFTRRSPEMVDRLMCVDCPLDARAIHNRLRSDPPHALADWLTGRNADAEPVRADASKIDPQAITTSLTNMENTIPNWAGDDMRTPCLVVHGQNDLAVAAPPDERVAALPPRLHYIALEQSGHFPMLDEIPRFNRLVADFLALDSGISPRELQLKDEWKRRVR
jgi:pimeloyl-ACP methyl ester carboxylesterase